MLSEKEIDDIIQQYFKQKHPFSRHHIDSYNEFIESILPKMISSYPMFPIVIKRNTGNVQRIEIFMKHAKPDIPHYTEKNGVTRILTPQKARMNNLTYSLTITVEVSVEVYMSDGTKHVSSIPDVILGKIPLVVKSNYCTFEKDIMSECKYEMGGYFIINGNEKVLITQERCASNIIQVHKGSGKYPLYAEIRSADEETRSPPRSISVKMSKSPNPSLYITIPRVRKDIPLFILMKALGCMTDKEAMYYICLLYTSDAADDS